MRVEGPNEWLNSFVIVKKQSGQIRVCLDPRPLNKELVDNYSSHVPQIESIQHQLSGKRHIKISKLDFAKGFWHLPLSDESKNLTTFGMPFGIFRYLTLPMGVKRSRRRRSSNFKELLGYSLFKMTAQSSDMGKVKKKPHDSIIKL